MMVALSHLELTARSIGQRWTASAAVCGPLIYIAVAVLILADLGRLDVKVSVLSTLLVFFSAIPTLHAAALGSRPWRRLGMLALGFLVTACILNGLIYGSPFPNLSDNTFKGSVSFGLLLVAGFNFYGFLLARAAYAAAEKHASRRWSDKDYDEEKAAWRAVELMMMLENDHCLLSPAGRDEVRSALRSLSIYFAADRSYGLQGYEGVRDRFRGAVRVLQELESWTLLPQEGTRKALYDEALEFAIVLTTGYFHYLPYRMTSSSTEGSLLAPVAVGSHRFVRITGSIAVASMPLLGYVLWSSFGPGIPAQINQWIGLGCVAGLIARLVTLLDPESLRTWYEVREILPRGQAGTGQRVDSKG